MTISEEGIIPFLDNYVNGDEWKLAKPQIIDFLTQNINKSTGGGFTATMNKEPDDGKRMLKGAFYLTLTMELFIPN